MRLVMRKNVQNSSSFHPVSLALSLLCAQTRIEKIVHFGLIKQYILLRMVLMEFLWKEQNTTEMPAYFIAW